MGHQEPEAGPAPLKALRPSVLRAAGRAEGSTGACSKGQADSSTLEQRDTGSSSRSPRQASRPLHGLSLCPILLGGAPLGLEPWRGPTLAGASWKERAEQGSHPRDRRPGGQTYLRSAEWAAMRFLRLLSARGQPERLKEKRWDIGVSQRGSRGGEGKTHHTAPRPGWTRAGTNLR